MRIYQVYYDGQCKGTFNTLEETITFIQSQFSYSALPRYEPVSIEEIRFEK